MKHLKHLLHLIFAFSLIFHLPSLMAQDSEIGLSKLSTEEEQKYQQILDTPVDVNSLNTTKINRYSEKAVAAIMLGNISKREEILLDWSNIDDEGKFNLRVFYSMMGRFEEAIKVTDQLLNSRDPRFIWNANRCWL
jgi:deoxyhypusine synthase